MKKTLVTIILILGINSPAYAFYDRNTEFCKYDDATPIVGEKSARIYEVQLLLKQKYEFAVFPTGRYDKQTKNAVKSFQYAFGLQTTGIINLATFARMKESAGCGQYSKKKYNQNTKQNIIQSLNRLYHVNPTTTVANGEIVVSVVGATTTTATIDNSPIKDPQQVQTDIINNLLDQQLQQKGLSIADPNRNLNSNDNLNSLSYYTEKPKDTKYDYIKDTIDKDGNVRKMLDIIHSRFILPKSIIVYFHECGEENAYFDPTRDTIDFCYEFINKFYKSNADVKLTNSQKIRSAIDFFLLHEFGHALVYYYDLPITGKEESAVDEFAAYVLFKIDDQESIDSAVDGMRQLYLMASDQSKLENSQYTSLFSDEHDLNLVRYYDLLKFMVGLFPEMKTSGWIGNATDQLPENQIPYAEKIAPRKIKTWDQLLQGKLR